MNKNDDSVMKRIFIAVKINPASTLLSMISDLKKSLEDERIKWTEMDNFHITLVFLGDTEAEKIAFIDRMLTEICDVSEPFDMVLEGAGVFKSLTDPRILWAGIHPSEYLNKLHDSIRTGLTGNGIVTEERDFNPHLTLGRIKNIPAKEKLKSLVDKYRDASIQNQRVSRIILYESQLFREGPVYKSIGEYSLNHSVA